MSGGYCQEKEWKRNSSSRLSITVGVLRWVERKVPEITFINLYFLWKWLFLAFCKTLGQGQQECYGGAAIEILAETPQMKRKQRLEPNSSGFSLETQNQHCAIWQKRSENPQLQVLLCATLMCGGIFESLYSISEDSSSDYIVTSDWNSFTASHGLQQQMLLD